MPTVCWKSKDNTECLAVLSDRICSVGVIDDGSSEQYCRMYGCMENIGKSWQTKCIASVGSKIVVQLLVFVCICS